MIADTIIVVLMVIEHNTYKSLPESLLKDDSIPNAKIELFKRASKEAVKSAERKTYKFFPYSKTINKKEK